MLTLSQAQVLELLENGLERHPLDRALLLLRCMHTNVTLSELADISIGQRDQMLLALRQELFGRELPGYIDCPECRTRLEFTLDTETFRNDANDIPIEFDGLRIHRPTSRDLASVMNEPDPKQAVYQLAQRCCMMTRERDLSGRLSGLNPTQIANIESALAEMDAAADFVLNFTCTECAYAWQTSFDIGDYLWREIDRYGSKLMNEIHILARAYGWNEHEILALSDARRASYIDRVLA